MHTVACKNEQLTLQCPAGEKLSILKANYGRTSKKVCNQFGYEHWDTTCVSPGTLDILRAACGGKASCSVKVNTANNNLNGGVDPCYGTEKYAEVMYECTTGKSVNR